MAGGDCGLTAKVFAANIDKVGLRGERGSERGAVHGVPGNRKLADNILERGSVGWGQIGGQVLPLGKGFRMGGLTAWAPAEHAARQQS
jgi:hypothetical protein